MTAFSHILSSSLFTVILLFDAMCNVIIFYIVNEFSSSLNSEKESLARITLLLLKC
jgi:hypothetical protein